MRKMDRLSPGLLLIFALSACALLALSGPAWSSGALEIHCLDVGQGDCTLIISPTGGTFLFDAGYNGQGTGTVLPHLSSLGLTALDYISASHYHADHIGGIDEVVASLGIDSVRVAVLDRGWSYTTQTYNSYASAVAAKRTTIYDGQVIDLGGGVTITCIAVNGNGQLSPPYDDEENDYCVSLLVQYGAFDFWVAGDLSGVNSSYYHDIETSTSGQAGEVEVYRVDHHGSSSNSNSNLVGALSPEVSIISVGSNSYGHPTQTVINRLVSADSYIYQTHTGSGGTIPAGSGEVVDDHIIIEVTTTSYTVNGDQYPLSGAGVEIARDGLWVASYPNPFSSSTTLSFSVPGGASAGIGIYDVTGRLVKSLPAPDFSGDVQSVVWDGRSADGREASAGFYFIRISSEPGSVTHKVIKSR
ncbi:MAG: MBL fold metallo-hydrolase [bacterium]|jgi:competence protein ComEC